MKRIFIISFLISSFFCQGQWTFNSENDPFDGTELYAVGEGSGGSFPYNNPRIIFRRNLKSNVLDVYVKGAGYSGCDNNVVDFSFGNANEVLSFSGIESINRDSVFLNFSMLNNSFLELNTLINNLKSKSIVYVEVRNDCRVSSKSQQTNNSLTNQKKKWIKKL